jgi:hypothetical protein
LQLAADITQVIDGKFQGYRVNEIQPWLIITAVDSSAYDVETVEEKILSQVRQQFQQGTRIANIINCLKVL